jgi:hypothetical protein
MENIQIDKVNYFGDTTDCNFNAKVLYYKNNKLNLVHIYIDFFNKSVYIPKQPKECKILKGLHEAIQFNQLINKYI